MKKLLLLTVLGMLLGNAFAVGPVQINPFIGANTSFYTNLENKSNAIGFQGGIITRIGGDKVYVGPGVIFLTQNVSTSDFDQSSEDAKTLSIQGFQVPLFIGYKVLDLKVTSLRVGVGPAVKFVSQYKYDGEDITDDLSDPNKALWSLKAEAVLTLATFSIGLDYDLGFSKIDKSIDDSPKVGRLGLNVGVSF